MTLKRNIFFSVTMLILVGMVFSISSVRMCERFDPESILVLKTGAAEEQSDGSYILAGRIINIGKDNILQHGFCWSESAQPTLNDRVTRLGARETEGAFTSLIDGLTEDT